jgi:hypothetical protein
MTFTIFERFCEGKFRDQRNEDRVHVGQHFVAVIDGSSAAQPLGGRAGGIVAAEVVDEVLSGLSPEASIVEFADTTREAFALVAASHKTMSPYAAAVVWSRRRAEIWRIGDCPFALDGRWNIQDLFPHERAFFTFRRMMLAGYSANRRKAGEEPGQGLATATADCLAMNKQWVNAGDEAFAYGMLDEQPVPARFLEVFPVPATTREIMLASDGAVVSVDGQRGPRNVAEMLAGIAAVKREDPNCVERFLYWRGFLAGATHLDDTTLVRIALRKSAGQGIEVGKTHL